jgi:hypothetical protein
MAKYKIVIPKAGASNELGTETKLYGLDEIIDAKEPWQKEMMGAFSANGWAIEVKIDAPEETGSPEPVETVDDDPERARNDKGHYVADDPDTPDVNEAYEGGKAPKPKAKKAAPKHKRSPGSKNKSTQKKS